MMSGAIVAPTVAPKVYRPIAMPRSFAGNHSDTAFGAAVQFPASPSPSRKRKMPSDPSERAKPVSRFAADHHATNTASEARTPKRSTIRPENNIAAV